MCYNLESTLSRQNLFLDLLVSSENTVSADVRTKPQKKKWRASEKSFSLFLLLSSVPSLTTEC